MTDREESDVEGSGGAAGGDAQSEREQETVTGPGSEGAAAADGAVVKPEGVDPERVAEHPVDPLADGRKRRPENNKLPPIAKLSALFLVNVALGLTYLLIFWFGGFEMPSTESESPFSWLYIISVLAASVFSALPMFVVGLSLGIQMFYYGLTGRAGEIDIAQINPFVGRIFMNNNDYFSQIFRFLVTVATYFSATVLVLQTGGFRDSPFSQIPFAIVILGPIIMTAPRTQGMNIVFGGLYISLMYYVDRPGEGNDNLEWLGSLYRMLPEGVEFSYWVEPSVLGVIVLSSLGLYLIRDVVSPGGRRGS